MICENGNFIRDLEEIVSEAHLISNEFQNEIRQAKYQIWNLVRQQIKNIKNRKKLDFVVVKNCAPCKSINYYTCEQIDACTEPCPELISLSDEISEESFQTSAINVQNNANYPGTIGRENVNFPNRLVTRSVTTFTIDEQNNTSVSVNRWFQFSKKFGKFLAALAIGFLIWIALVYGVLLGVSLCSNGSCLFTYTRRIPVL